MKEELCQHPKASNGVAPKVVQEHTQQRRRKRTNADQQGKVIARDLSTQLRFNLHADAQFVQLTRNLIVRLLQTR